MLFPPCLLDVFHQDWEGRNVLLLRSQLKGGLSYGHLWKVVQGGGAGWWCRVVVVVGPLTSRDPV